MSDTLKSCPFCPAVVILNTRLGDTWVDHPTNTDCPLSHLVFTVEEWNSRSPSPVDLSEEEKMALEGGCSCHGYECNCDSGHLSILRPLCRRLLASRGLGER